MSRLLAVLLALPIALAAQNGAAPPKASFAEPGISPDGATIAFVSGGDIWEVPSRGGEARLLVSHQANELRPMFSPDGSRLAFTSTRTGNGDIYVLTIATGEPASMPTMAAPADSPNSVTLSGFPPKLAMLAFTQRNVAMTSASAWFPDALRPDSFVSSGCE